MTNNKQKFGDLGQHWTPEEIVNKMVELRKNKGNVLEPSAGTGMFLNKFTHITAIEIDSSVIPSKLRKHYLNINFFNYSIDNKFDTIIGNPPYVAGKLLEDDWLASWKGDTPKQGNAYLHFIEKSLYHLKDGGELIFIVPSTLLSGTSRGAKLRKKMLEEGSFTNIIFQQHNIWDNADVNTLIFRWEKVLQQSTVDVDGVVKTLFHNNGFIWIIDYKPFGVIGDYFKIEVGSAPLIEDIKNGEKSDNYDYYFKHGELIKIDESNRENWPRVKDTKKVDKIFFNAGMTRKWPVFWYGNYEKHISYVMIPKTVINVAKISKVFNVWFKENGEKLNLIKDGRWNIGVKEFASLPINNYLYKKLNS